MTATAQTINIDQLPQPQRDSTLITMTFALAHYNTGVVLVQQKADDSGFKQGVVTGTGVGTDLSKPSTFEAKICK